MDYRFLKYNSPAEAVGVLTISHLPALNALSREILEELDHFICNLPEGLKALIITGDGPKSFVAGADISQMAGFNQEQGLEFGRFGAKVFRAIEELPIPVIAAINGFALGGGCELACACDIRIASSNARFGQPEVNLGIIPGFSGTYRLAKLIGQGYAKELIYTGRMIKADEALRIGLVNHVYEPEVLMEEALKLAGDIATSAPIAVCYAKACINENYDLDKSDALELESQMFGRCFSTEDQKAGMQAFLEKRTPEFKNR